jgi:transcriptional regulator with XRE-family HTH domain
MANSRKTKFEMAIVDKVATIRRERGLSQKQIADILEVTKGFIGQIESSNSPSTYSVNHLNRLAYELGCSLHDLIPSQPIVEKDWDLNQL